MTRPTQERNDTDKNYNNKSKKENTGINTCYIKI